MKSLYQKVYSEETLSLLERVKTGNEKLFRAWEQIREMKGESWIKGMDNFAEAHKKLRNLCHKLQLLGYNDCLYMVDGKKTKNCHNQVYWCQVCPSQIRYWEMEL